MNLFDDAFTVWFMGLSDREKFYALIKIRTYLRRRGKLYFKLADVIRDELSKCGVGLEDLI